ncbi:carboxypeptidase-like regulatory domain-containing protein [uncultured Gimesia sp.]|uniref:carboxypeptidase-like regulatory domain-containing protein n=1 Tax=uncultured Gimesia sp. TaxID=1678688 RepID=UPI0030D78D95
MMRYRIHKLIELFDTPVGFTLIFVTLGPLVLRMISPIFVLSALLLPGCQGGTSEHGPTGSLSGKVTYKGEPVKEGMVQFNNPEKGFGGQAVISEEGTYTVTNNVGGLVTGTYQVSVVPPMIEKSFGPDTPPSEVPKEMPNIPQKYHYPKTSGLSIEIKAGENTFDIDMQ